MVKLLGAELVIKDSELVKNQKLLKTVCNNVFGATLFNVVNNIVQ